MVSRPPQVPLAVVAAHVSGSFLTLLRWWLDHGMRDSPEDMEAYFQRLVMPGILSLKSDGL